MRTNLTGTNFASRNKNKESGLRGRALFFCPEYLKVTSLRLHFFFFFLKLCMCVGGFQNTHTNKKIEGEFDPKHPSPHICVRACQGLLLTLILPLAVSASAPGWAAAWRAVGAIQIGNWICSPRTVVERLRWDIPRRTRFWIRYLKIEFNNNDNNWVLFTRGSLIMQFNTPFFSGPAIDITTASPCCHFHLGGEWQMWLRVQWMNYHTTKPSHLEYLGFNFQNKCKNQT